MFVPVRVLSHLFTFQTSHDAQMANLTARTGSVLTTALSVMELWIAKIIVMSLTVPAVSYIK